MRFRPCIDIHNGKVKQIVGSTLKDAGDAATDNFVSEQGAAYYAEMYKKDGLAGGHIILLNPASSEYYEKDCEQAFEALAAYPGGMQIGGGIDEKNAQRFINKGASHVIVTSYVFRDGKLDMKNLKKLTEAVGREHIVLDLSCRRRDEKYFIVTDRWQKFTEMEVTRETFEMLQPYCAEFLVHAVDVEGKSAGIDSELVAILAAYDGLPVTYAGGVRDFADLTLLKKLGHGRLDVTIGSALDIFGGAIPYTDVVGFCEL